MKFLNLSSKALIWFSRKSL